MNETKNNPVQNPVEEEAVKPDADNIPVIKDMQDVIRYFGVTGKRKIPRLSLAFTCLENDAHILDRERKKDGLYIKVARLNHCSKYSAQRSIQRAIDDHWDTHGRETWELLYKETLPTAPKAYIFIEKIYGEMKKNGEKDHE